MSRTLQSFAITVCAALSLTGAAHAQQTTIHVKR